MGAAMARGDVAKGWEEWGEEQRLVGEEQRLAKKSHLSDKNWTRAGAEAVKKGSKPGVKAHV